MTRPPPRSTPFPYPTLSRSRAQIQSCPHGEDRQTFPPPQILEDRQCPFPVTAGCGRLAGIEEIHQMMRHTAPLRDRKSTRLNSSHSQISYAVFCLKTKHRV